MCFIHITEGAHCEEKYTRQMKTSGHITRDIAQQEEKV